MQYFHKDYLKYTIPDEWIAEEREDVLTIYSPAGEGAMTLSFYSLIQMMSACTVAKKTRILL
jgi:hypothetical protein